MLETILTCAAMMIIAIGGAIAVVLNIHTGYFNVLNGYTQEASARASFAR